MKSTEITLIVLDAFEQTEAGRGMLLIVCMMHIRQTSSVSKPMRYCVRNHSIWHTSCSPACDKSIARDLTSTYGS
jgi:hypothetical protein